MTEFINETLMASIFWTALSAIGTLLAVFVALFSPAIARKNRSKRIVKLIEAEIEGNKKIIINMVDTNTSELSDGVSISPLQRNNALLRNIDLRLWHEYRYQLAASDPQLYNKFHDINRYAEAILDAPSEPDALRLVYTRDAAVSFIEKFNQAFSQ